MRSEGFWRQNISAHQLWYHIVSSRLSVNEEKVILLVDKNGKTAVVLRRNMCLAAFENFKVDETCVRKDPTILSIA